MDKTPIREIVNNYLFELEKNNIKYEKIFLFGSFANNNANKNSDIDLALVFNKIEQKFKMRLKLMELRRKVDLRIEPHPFEISAFNNNNPVVAEILKYGVEINS